MAAVKSDTVTVASKLPFDFVAEVEGTKVTFNGAKIVDGLGEKYLTDGFGLTPNVDAGFYEKWAAQAGDFAALKNGTIFAEVTAEAADGEAKERKKTVKSGLEQKTAEELGVKVTEEKKD